MIVLSDNDLILKLAGCNLLGEFFETLQVDGQDVLITDEAGYALPKQAKKKLKNVQAVDTVSKFVERVGRVPLVNPEILNDIQDFPNMDGGESLLMIAAYENPNAYFATGDKRCLQSLIDNKLNKPVDDIFNSLQNRVYCLETAFLLLIENLGFEKVNTLVVNCDMGKMNDAVLNMAFGSGRNIDNAKECLNSYCKDLRPLLVPVNLMKK